MLHYEPRRTYEAVQVAYDLSDDNREREFSGLLAALSRFNLRQGTIVTAGQKDSANLDGYEISIVPATEFLT